MAYAVKYLFKFQSSNGTVREIRVLQDGYSGAVIQRPLGRAPVIKKEQNGGVHGTSLTFYAECHVDREFIEFYTSDPKEYRVDVYAGSTLLWQGYITPELYSEPDIAPPYDVEVVATDGVGELKLYDFAPQGTVTLRSLLSYLLGYTGLSTDVNLVSSLKPGSHGAGALLDMQICVDYLAGKTCYEALTYLLDTLNATITRWGGAWLLVRETNVTFTNDKVRYFNTAGNSALLSGSVQTLGSMRSAPAWPVGQLSMVIDPAKNKVAVQAPWHPVTCLANADMASDTAWAKANNASYGPDGYLFPNNDTGGSSYATAHISQSIASAGLRVPMSFELKATGVAAQVGARVGAVIGVLITYTVGNTVYLLRRGDEGTPVWKEGSAPGSSIDGSLVDYQQPLASFDADRIQAETLSIDEIPAFVQGTSYPSGTLTVYVIGTCARAYSAHLDVVLPKGYQDVLRIDNGARGEGDTVEIAIGRETAEVAYYAAFLQGLLLDNGALITSFSDANFEGMNYLALIARDYALSVALPRASVKGNVYLESSIGVPPLVFAKGGLNYWIETWSWDLYEDELEISARTLPSASLTVQSETILESDGSTVSSASTAGSSGGGGGSFPGGVNYFELDDTLVRLKGRYDYLGPRKGLIFEGVGENESSDADLYVKEITVGSSTQRVLYSPLPLITEGDQIVGSGTPGGGGGGGATYMRDLEDVSLTNLSNGQMLAWDASLRSGQGAWKNVPAPTGTITSVALASGTNNGTLKLTVNGVATDNIAVTGWSSKADASALANYLPLTGGTISSTVGAPVTINSTSSSGQSVILFQTSTTNKTAVGYLSSIGSYLYDYTSSTYINIKSSGEIKKNDTYTFYHSGNSNKSDVAWTASSLTLNGAITGATSIDSILYFDTTYSAAAIGDSTSHGFKFYVNGITHSVGAITSGSSITCDTILGVKSTTANGTSGISLYNGNLDYSINFVQTATTGYGTYGEVTGTFATYFNIDYSYTTWGWIFRRKTTPVASLSTGGYLTLASGATINGAVTLSSTLSVGGNTSVTGNISATANGSSISAYSASMTSSSNMGGAAAEIGVYHEFGAYIWANDAGNTAIQIGRYTGATRYNLLLQPFGGNVGIGTDSPGAKLHINGSTFHEGNCPVAFRPNFSWASGIYHDTSGFESMNFVTSNSGTTFRFIGGVGDFSGWASGGVTDNFTPWLTISSSGLSVAANIVATGNVGIGTSSPGAKLDVTGTSSSVLSVPYAGDGLMIHTTGNAANNFALFCSVAETTLGTVATPALVVRATGNVGIGTSSPAYKLDVNGDAVFGTSGSCSLYFRRNYTNWFEATDASGQFGWRTNSTNIMVFDSSGRLGIGTQLPAYKLDISSGSVGDGLRLTSTTTYSCIIYTPSGSGKNWSVGANNDGQFYFYSNTAIRAYLTQAGVFVTTGDQVVSSDATLKTNLQDVTYSVEDIAKTRAVTFDWKDGRGRSAGSIAQDWQPLIPELVHGEEGSMTLAYGQIALVNTIIEAREIEVLKKRVAELEDEVKRLRS